MDDTVPPADEPTDAASDPTTELDPTTALPQQPRAVDPDRVDQGEVLRFMAKRVLVWFVPLLLIGILLIALGLPVWLIVVALAIAMAIVVFELEI